MKERDVIIFGCDEYALQLAENLKGSCRSIKLFTMQEESLPVLKGRGFEAALFDIGDNWDLLEEYDPKRLVAYCAVCEEAKNIFLTISLRTSFRDMDIFALATDNQNAAKLKAAGANKTIVTTQVAANTIVEMLDKPTASGMMQRILRDNSQIHVAQIVVSKKSEIHGKLIKEIDFEEIYDIIVIAVLDDQLQTLFTFVKKGSEHKIEAGDILVAVGYEDALSKFREVAGEHLKEDWAQWR